MIPTLPSPKLTFDEWVYFNEEHIDDIFYNMQWFINKQSVHMNVNWSDMYKALQLYLYKHSTCAFKSEHKKLHNLPFA